MIDSKNFKGKTIKSDWKNGIWEKAVMSHIAGTILKLNLLLFRLYDCRQEQQ
jgi:hypothetical protein